LDNEVRSLESQQSLTLHLINKNEWLVWFEVDWWFWCISVHYIPLLVQSIVEAPYDNISVVHISSATDIKNLSFFVDNIAVLDIE
jgi:hypothetical protein